MPSHSSSSSSSRSHSNSSTSHSSSSSSSSSHSDRDRSSYSSDSSSRSYDRYHKQLKKYYKPRPKTNQPTGYSKHKWEKGYKPEVEHYCAKHTYTHYTVDWEDKGVYYRAGYYDEEGNYYKEVVFADAHKQYTRQFDCAYCGNHTLLTWSEGDFPHCNNCGAIMETSEFVTDVQIYEEEVGLNRSIRKSKFITPILILGFPIIVPTCLLILVLPMILIAELFIRIAPIEVAEQLELKNKSLIATVIEDAKNDQNHKTSSNVNSNSTSSETWALQSNTSPTNIEIWGDKLVMQYITDTNDVTSSKMSDNAVVLHNEFKDKEFVGGDIQATWDYYEDSYSFQYYYMEDNEQKFVDGYLWYNTDVTPYLWQYYYIGISDTYPDGLGWMEYTVDSSGNNCWKIEKENGWVVYEGDTSHLFHINNPFDKFTYHWEMDEYNRYKEPVID